MNDLLKLINEGHLPTLIKFDKEGFIIGADETLKDYAYRIEKFYDQNEQLQKDLIKKGSIEVEDLKLNHQDTIPIEFFNKARKHTENLYGFSLKQISGFFVNLGLLFGGCAYIFPENNFSLFFIRSSFKTKVKWFIYGRDEIIAHEMCHISRIALKSQIFEEIFAYQTSKSKFRRYFASMLQESSDTYLIISSIILTVIGQFIDFFYPPDLWFSSVQIWAWGLFIIIISYFLTRQIYYLRQLKKTTANLLFLTDEPLKLAFRLTDIEILTIAKQETLSEKSFTQFIDSQSKSSQRSKILISCFL